MLSGCWVRSPIRGGIDGAVADRPYVGESANPKIAFAKDVAFAIDRFGGQVQTAYRRIRRDARTPYDGARRELLSGAQTNPIRRDLLDRRPQTDIDAKLREPQRCIPR